MIDNQETIPEITNNNEVINPLVPQVEVTPNTEQISSTVEDEDRRLGLKAEEQALLRESNTPNTNRILDSNGFLIGLGNGNEQSTNPEGKNADDLLGFLNKKN